MKKYTNRTNDMKTIRFEDGTSQFLERGQVFTTAKDVKRVEKGIKVSDVRKTKTRSSTTTEDTADTSTEK